MLTYFPKYISNKSIALYFITLIVVSVIFFDYSMSFLWVLIGSVEVVTFFYFSNSLTRTMKEISPKLFEKKIFIYSFIIRFFYVLVSYWFYWEMTGSEFDFESGDVIFYDQIARGAHECVISGGVQRVSEYFSNCGINISDSGYPIYLTIIYTIFDDSIIMTRVLKSFWSSLTCVLVYRLARRNFGDSIGKMSAVLCMLMPNLIYYCGMHLKEVEMVFLTVLFVERTDNAFRSDKMKWKELISSIFIVIALFAFRTALAAVLLLALMMTVLFSKHQTIKTWNKWIVGVVMFLGIAIFTGNEIKNDVNELWQAKDTKQQSSMEWRSKREGGNIYAKYAGVAVFAPLIFTIPFSTMVDTGNQNHVKMIHGGNFVKNIISYFTIFSLFLLLFSGKWRQHVLLISVLCGYLAVIALSEFAQSERFHQPALPFTLIFVSYGIANMNRKYMRWFNYWLCFVFLANVAWNWFKLAGRGLI